MTTNKFEFGSTATFVAHNIQYHRVRLGLTYTGLSRRLTKLDRDIPTLGLARIESCRRRVDTDDLMALAVALEVSPISLLMPPDVNENDLVPTTGFTDRVPAKSLWNWLNGSYPLTGQPLTFYSHALPKWERDDIESRLGAVRP